MTVRLFEIIKKYYEDKLLLKTVKLKSKISINKQNKKQQVINELLSLDINRDYILELSHRVTDDNGKFKYFIKDYFLCDKNLKQIYYRDRFKVVKLTGYGVGKQFNLCPNADFSLTYVSISIKDKVWEGDMDKIPHIPQHCITIADLIEYTNQQNEMRKQMYYSNTCQTIQNPDICK